MRIMIHFRDDSTKPMSIECDAVPRAGESISFSDGTVTDWFIVDDVSHFIDNGKMKTSLTVSAYSREFIYDLLDNN